MIESKNGEFAGDNPTNSWLFEANDMQIIIELNLEIKVIVTILD